MFMTLIYNGIQTGTQRLIVQKTQADFTRSFEKIDHLLNVLPGRTLLADRPEDQRLQQSLNHRRSTSPTTER
jgi:hypothetical protein